MERRRSMYLEEKMKSRFHEELEEIKREVLAMGNLAREMLKNSVTALVKRDNELADEVLSHKGEIMDMDDKIEQRCLQAISMYQPMAKDMRVIGTCLKLITYLARIGRYGKDIANVAKELSGKPHLAKLVSIPYMAKLADSMISDALIAFEKEDISLLENFVERDDDIDALRYSIFRECLSYMVEDPKKITRCTHYVMIARYLERCADHACKMAEKITYTVTGERVEIK
jgi:phosphate transport system protein